SDLTYLISSVVSGAVFLFFGLVLYKARVWGDGDAWIMGGLGFLLPAAGSAFSYPITGEVSYALYFLLSLMAVGGVYSFFYIAVYGVFRGEIRKSFAIELARHRAAYGGMLLGAIAASFVLPYFFLFGLVPFIYAYAKTVEKGMKRKVKPSEIREGDVLAGGDIKGATKEDLCRIRAAKKPVEVQDGIR
ncbi:MAG: hypothetical protein ACP5E4_03865, partial [Candidatus Aenigmatarchaeota archaeon]